MVLSTYPGSTTVIVCSRISCTVFAAFRASTLAITYVGLSGIPCKNHHLDPISLLQYGAKAHDSRTELFFSVSQSEPALSLHTDGLDCIVETKSWK